MELEINIHREGLVVRSAAPTVVQPGEPVKLTIRMQSETQLIVFAPEIKTRGNLPAQATGPATGFPRSLEAGETYDLSWVVYPGIPETIFGWLEIVFPVQQAGSGQTKTVQWSHWLSVFKKETAGLEGFISDDHRDRLIGVVNAHWQNGHLFLADYRSFFREYLHLEIPEQVAGTIGEELGLPIEGLPLPFEDFLEIARGEKRFYGLEKLELFAEDAETCEDCYEYENLNEQDPYTFELN